MFQWVGKAAKKFLGFWLDKATRIMVRLSQAINRYADRGTPAPYTGVRERRWHNGEEIYLGTHIE